MWTPSPRLTAALAAAMLAVGVAVGAAIGPAPAASLGQGLPLPELLPRLLAAAGVGRQASTPTPAITATATPTVHRRKRKHKHQTASSAAGSEGTTSTSQTTSTSTTPATTKTGKTKKAELPPVTHVWLIELSGSSFESALETAASAPYIDGQAVPAGTLLSGWSALQAGAFASDATLLGSSTPPQVLDTILQPPCPEGAAGEACAPDTPGALSAANEFLQQTLGTITSTAAYREHGLIVVTFATVAAGASSGLAAGSATSTVTAQPPVGALLISPFAKPAARSTATFDPSSPTQSLETLLHK
jgi:hypothetical protein